MPASTPKLILLLAITLLLPTVTSLSLSLRRGLQSLRSAPRSRSDLKKGIAGFYDRSSKLWEDVWGEHMHHGYYDPPDRTDHEQAQVDMIDELLKFSGVDGSEVSSVVDVGCGIGGSSRHIARRFDATAEGVTLSPYQAGRGNELAKEQGLEGKGKPVLDLILRSDSLALI